MENAPSETRTNVFIVEDSAPIRERLTGLLNGIGGVSVVGEAATPQSAVEGILRTRPDSVVLDIQLMGGTGIEVLRSAFADVCVWQGGRFLWLSVHSGKIATFSPNAEVVFDAMTEKHFRKSVLLERLFAVARKRYGDLGAEDCFGFAPLPALGGAIAEQYLIKARMREYTATAAQVLR